MKSNKYVTLLVILFFSASFFYAGANEKPSVWIFTDLSDPRERRVDGHPQNDPDDICSMASLFLSANRFNIKNIVVSASKIENLKNPMPFVNDVLLAAYYHDLPYLNERIGGFQEQIPVEQSICTRGEKVIQFNESQSYADLTGLGTVEKLIEDAGNEKIFVLSWGSLSEPAMAVKHCIETGNSKALRNMVFISHWTKSMVAQGTEDEPFEVANCRLDRNACAYLHQVAYENPLVTFIEMGCVGQLGIVEGITNPYRQEFEKSRLGEIFVRSKFYNGKPDFSDASTFWLLTGEFGVSVNDYPQDGSLTLEQEKQMIEKFRFGADKIVLDLLHRSNMAAKANNPFEKDFLSQCFTYIYKRTKYYTAYLPYDGVLTIYNKENKPVQKNNFEAGNHKLDFTNLPQGEYKVIVELEGIERHFTLLKE